MLFNLVRITKIVRIRRVRFFSISLIRLFRPSVLTHWHEYLLPLSDIHLNRK